MYNTHKKGNAMEIRNKLIDLLKTHSNKKLDELYEIKKSTINTVLDKEFIKDPVQFTRIYYAWYNEFKKWKENHYV